MALPAHKAAATKADQARVIPSIVCQEGLAAELHELSCGLDQRVDDVGAGMHLTLVGPERRRLDGGGPAAAVVDEVVLDGADVVGAQDAIGLEDVDDLIRALGEVNSRG